MRRFLAAITVALLLAACGTTTTVVTRTIPTSTILCRTGAAVMGCSIGAEPNPAPPPAGIRGVTPPVPGCVFPDVSSYQAGLTLTDWRQAAKSICAAVAKAGESTSIVDPAFARFVSYFRALHIRWAPYWFVRTCNDGPFYVKTLESVGYKSDPLALRPVLDMEVPSAHGCAVPVADLIHRVFGVWPIIYTAPGTWPGGSTGGLDVWEADYTAAATPVAMPFPGMVLAWQRYSPPYLYRLIPGLGFLDVSIDLRGFSQQLAFPAKPKPPVVTHTTTIPPAPSPTSRAVCWGPHATAGTTICKVVLARHAWLINRRDFWQHEFNRCIRYANGIGCATAEHWWLLRRRQALELHGRYS